MFGALPAHVASSKNCLSGVRTLYGSQADRTKKQGKLFIRSDSKIFRFQNGKSESLFLQRKNPRRIAWTVLCRRQRRKGISEVRDRCPEGLLPRDKMLTVLQEQAKTRRRKQVKAQRAVVGASLDVIKERRSQRPEARSAARKQAIEDGKKKRAATESAKKAEKAKTAAKSAAGQTTGRYVHLHTLSAVK